MILQDERAACGHACVLMIVNFWGHRLDMQGLFHLYKPSVRGITLSEVDTMFATLGFNTRALRVPLSDMHLIKTPAILHWNMNHFVVLKRVKKRRVIIHDPAVGVRTCGWKELGQAFTGIVLEVTKREDFQKIRHTKTLTLRTILKSVNGVFKMLGLLLMLSFLIECLRVVNPLLMQYIIDYALGSNYLSQMYRIGIGFTLFVVFQGVLEYIRNHLVLFSTMQLREGLTTHTFKHLLSLPLSFFEHRHLGDIHSKFQTIEHIQAALSTDFVYTFLDGLMVVLTLVVMITYSWLLSCIVCVALLIYVGMRLLSFRRYRSQHAAAIVSHAKCASSFLETLRAMLPIKCYLKESTRFQVWQNDYIDALNHDIQVSKLHINYQIGNQIVLQLDHIMVICVGAGLVLSKQLTIGMLLAFLAYRLMLVNKASSLIQHVFDYQLIRSQLQRLNDIIQQPQEVAVVPRVSSIAAVKGCIRVQELCFRYHPQAPWVLNQLNFDIRVGEKIAIVGPSGCGKSTLLKILMGLERPVSGTVLIDDKPLEILGIQAFRTLTATVMQDDTLFSGSIVDNITFFAEEYEMTRVYDVALLTGMHETIMAMPMGYETLVGQMGSVLSGGQKQRLLLARALYKEPKFLFLDEATSHLDAASERHINHALQSLRMTQIMIAHRQETIDMADRVIELT
jgi:ATP-binding cassette subfamily B protein RaxB